ncbi:MAG: 7-cyano-7-deazaguanine synthase [Gemmatimonadota bacterium]
MHTPLMYLTKAETVRLAHRLPGCWDALGLSVTCYEGERPGCGSCPACKLRSQGFEEAGLVDPAR